MIANDRSRAKGNGSARGLGLKAAHRRVLRFIATELHNLRPDERHEFHATVIDGLDSMDLLEILDLVRTPGGDR